MTTLAGAAHSRKRDHQRCERAATGRRFGNASHRQPPGVLRRSLGVFEATPLEIATGTDLSNMGVRRTLQNLVRVERGGDVTKPV